MIMLINRTFRSSDEKSAVSVVISKNQDFQITDVNVGSIANKEDVENIYWGFGRWTMV